MLLQTDNCKTDMSVIRADVCIWNEGNVLFNDALNTFYLQSYGVGHMVKDHYDSKRKPTATTTWVTFFN